MVPGGEPALFVGGRGTECWGCLGSGAGGTPAFQAHFGPVGGGGWGELVGGGKVWAGETPAFRSIFGARREKVCGDLVKFSDWEVGRWKMGGLGGLFGGGLGGKCGCWGLVGLGRAF